MKNKAKLIAIMDVSGSMGITKKTMAFTRYNLFKGIISTMYDHMGEVAIAVTCVSKYAKNFKELVSNGESGGTYLSTGLELAIREVKNAEANEDTFVLFFSDGDNWGEDNDKFIELMKDLSLLADYVEFNEVKISTYVSTVLDRIINECDKSLVTTNRIFKTDDILNGVKDTYYRVKNLEERNPYKEIDTLRTRNQSEVKYIKRKNRDTIVELRSGEIGVATCGREEKYDDEVGFQLALLRAKQKKIENEINKFLE